MSKRSFRPLCSFLPVLIITVAAVADAATISPRVFLESLNYTPMGGSYSVIPVINDHMLDLSFHVDRLCFGFETLSGCRGSVDYSTLRTHVIDAIYKARILAESRPLMSIGSTAIVTVAMYRDNRNDKISFSALYTPMNSSVYTSASSRPELVADVHYFQRRLPNVKDIRWPEDRKIIESRRKGDDIDESLLVSDKIDFCKDAFTEGLISNLFIMDKSYNILTCPSSFVLPGGMAKIVKNICHKYNINVIDTPSSLRDLPNWRCAFLVSCSKPIRVLKGLYLPTTSSETREGDYYSLLEQSDERSDSIIRFIKQKLSHIFVDALEGQYSQHMYGASWDPIVAEMKGQAVS